MRLTTKTRYAIRAICELASCSGDRPVPLKAIADRQSIKQKYLEQIFILLKRAEIVGSRKGPNGGYYLKKKPESIRLIDVMTAVGETTAPVFCVDAKSTQTCSRRKQCLTHPYWKSLKSQIDLILQTSTIGDLCGCRITETSE